MRPSTNDTALRRLTRDSGTVSPGDQRITELEQYYEGEIHHSRLYPNLDTIVDKGLIEKAKADRRTNVYTLTARSRREIEARREWEDQYVGELLSE